MEDDQESSKDSKEDQVTKKLYIIAGSVAGAAVLAGFVAATLLARRKRMNNARRMEVAHNRLQQQSSMEGSYGSVSSMLNKVEPKSPDDSVISMSDLSLKNTQSST